MAQQIQIRRGTAAEWTTEDPTMADGELGYETDTGKFKIGDGSTAWVSLGYYGTHTGEVTGFGALSLDKSAISGKTLATIVGSDHVLFGDASDSGNLKKGLASDLLGGGSSGIITLCKTVDETIASSTTLQGDDELKLDVLSGENWSFEFLLFASEAANNPNIKLRLAATLGLTGTIEYVWNKLGSSESGVISDFTTDTSAINLGNTKSGILIKGTVKATANGTLHLEWAQDFSDTDATTVHALSKLVAHKE